MNKAVFLDRDGVINATCVRNGKPYPPNSLEEFKILPGVREGLQTLRIAGFKLFIITNQPDVARGKTPQEKVDNIHLFIKNELPIDEVRCCFHDDIDNCSCRKPKPGMILELSEKWQINLSNSYIIGDRWRDIEAGKRAGVISLLIDYNYDEKRIEPDYTCSDFSSAVNNILNSQ